MKKTQVPHCLLLLCCSICIDGISFLKIRLKLAVTVVIFPSGREESVCDLDLLNDNMPHRVLPLLQTTSFERQPVNV